MFCAVWPRSAASCLRCLAPRHLAEAGAVPIIRGGDPPPKLSVRPPLGAPCQDPPFCPSPSDAFHRSRSLRERTPTACPRLVGAFCAVWPRSAAGRWGWVRPPEFACTPQEVLAAYLGTGARSRARQDPSFSPGPSGAFRGSRGLRERTPTASPRLVGACCAVRPRSAAGGRGWVGPPEIRHFGPGKSRSRQICRSLTQGGPGEGGGFLSPPVLF